MSGIHAARGPGVRGRGFLSKPSTKLGWWAVGLAAAFAVLFIINATVFMPSTVAVPWRQVLPTRGV